MLAEGKKKEFTRNPLYEKPLQYLTSYSFIFILISARTTGVWARVASAEVCSWVCANASTPKRVADATI